MKIIDIGGEDGICLKCHVGLSAEEKRSRMPICTKCITELVDIVKGSIDIDGIEEFSEDVSSFTDFVSSSARLMGLDDIVIIQVCFNIYMDGVRDVADRNPTMARKIFKDARRFIDIELERLEDSGEDDFGKNDSGDGREIFEKMMGSISKMMKDCHGANGENGDVSGREDNINKERVDNASCKDNTENESMKEEEDGGKNGGKEGNENGSKEGNEKGIKSGSKRIRVD